jgi:RNA polymerase sigma factor (sigma-70 family)
MSEGSVDELAVVRAQQGDAAAFACLVERHGRTLRRFCARLAGKHGSADDLFQESLLRAFQALPRLGDPQRFEAWLLAIAANLARTWWRQQARWPLSIESLSLAYPDLPWEALRSPVWSPDRIVEDAEQGQILRRALESLPPAMSHAVALHYLDGLDYQEIAAALDVPISTVRGRLFTSRRRLRAALVAAGWSGPASTTKRARPGKTTRAAAKGHPMHPGMLLPSGPAGAALEEAVVDSIRLNLLLPSRVVTLKAKARERYLPITIGVPEADAIAIKLQGKEVPRPLTHDLLLNAFAQLGARVTCVVVNDYQGDTFYAQVHLQRDGVETIVDARPSDGMALAVRAGAPLYVAAAVLEQCGRDTPAPPGAPNGALPPTERAQQAFALARQEMARFGRASLTSDLLLLGILAEGQSSAARVLAAAGAGLSQARTAVAVLSGFGDQQPAPFHLSEPANPAFRTLAETAARELGARYVGAEHLLLAMLAEEAGPARRVLDHLSIDTAALRPQLAAALRQADEQPPPSP